MDFKKCSRCGNFYLSNTNVCPKCSTKENFEFSTFKSYIEENGLGESIDEISGKTGISVKNLNRFIEYNSQNNGNDETFGNNTEYKTSNDGIQFLL
ncbi:MAG: hypothetical protein J5881_03440 [Clostridia bacterium]|nr:hypothetical protein [Clostridia bacterium]